MAAIAARILADAPPRFALAGLSMGGYIAFAMMRQAPERIAKLALLDTSARADMPEQTGGREKLDRHGGIGKADEEIADADDPAFSARQPSAVTRRSSEIVRDMAAETGAEAFVRQLKRSCRGRIRGRCWRASAARRWCWWATATWLTPPELDKEIAAGIAGARS